MSVTVFGSINVDVTAYSDRLPSPGETLHGERYIIGLGGKGANQAAAAARLTSGVRLIGRVGNDTFGKMALDELNRFGLSPESVLLDDANATGIAIIGVEKSGQNVITVIGGANLAIDASDVARSRAAIAAGHVLLLQLEVPLEASLAAAAAARAAGALVILDPAPAPAGGLSAGELRQVDIITPNETETEALTGFRPDDAASGLAAARRLRNQGVGTALVKLGAAGVAVSGPDGEVHVPAFRVATIDTVAAGDCFNGALAVALAEEKPIREAVRFAAAAAALSTTRRGASASAPERAEVEELLRQS